MQAVENLRPGGRNNAFLPTYDISILPLIQDFQCIAVGISHTVLVY